MRSGLQRLSNWFYSNNESNSNQPLMSSSSSSLSYGSVSIGVTDEEEKKAGESENNDSPSEIIDSQEFRMEAMRSSAIRASFFRADLYIRQTSALKFGLLGGGVGFLLAVALNRVLEILPRQEREILDSIWNSYLSHPCSADLNTFSTFPEVVIVTPNHEALDSDSFIPLRYCLGYAGVRFNFEISQALSRDCLFLLKNACEREEKYLVFKKLWNDDFIFIANFSLFVGGGIGAVYLRWKIMNVTQAVEQAEVQSLVSQGVIPDQAGMESRPVLMILHNQTDIQSTYVYLRKVREIVSGFFPSVYAPVIIDYLIRELELVVQSELFQLRCESFQIREYKESKREPADIISTFMNNVVGISSNPHLFLRPRNNTRMLPQIINIGILEYVDFAECGVVVMSLSPDEEKAVELSSIVNSLDVDDQESVLSTDQLLDKVQLAIESSSVTENAVYVRVNELNEKYLFYFNRGREELIKLNLNKTQLLRFDQISHPTHEVTMLTLEQLGNIKEVTKHDHYEKFDDPCVHHSVRMLG